MLRKVTDLFKFINENDIGKREISHSLLQFLNDHYNDNEELINNFKELSDQEAKKRMRLIFARRYARKLARELFKDGDFELRDKFIDDIDKRLMELDDIENYLTLINGLKFIELAKGLFSDSFTFQIISKYFFYYITYRIGLPDVAIILTNNLPTHRTSQQHFFKNLEAFIVAYAEMNRWFLDDPTRFDKRNKDAIIWADMISKLINPETKKRFDFDS